MPTKSFSETMKEKLAKAKAEKAKAEAEQRAKAEAEERARAGGEERARAGGEERAKAQGGDTAEEEKEDTNRKNSGGSYSEDGDAQKRAEAEAQSRNDKEDADAKARKAKEDAQRQKQADGPEKNSREDTNALTDVPPKHDAQLGIFFDFRKTWETFSQIDIAVFADGFANVLNIIFKNLRRCQTKSIVDAGKRLMLGATILVIMTLIMFSFLYIVHTNNKECNVNGFYEIYTFFKLAFAFTMYGVLTEYLSDVVDLRCRLCIVSLVCLLVFFLVPDCNPVGFNTKEKANDEVLRSFDHYMHEHGIQYHALRPSFDLIALRRKCALGVSERHLTEECIEAMQNVFQDVSNIIEPSLIQVFKMPHIGIPQTVRMLAYRRSYQRNQADLQTLDVFAYKDVDKKLPGEDKIIPMMPFLHRKMQNGHVYLKHYRKILGALKGITHAHTMGLSLLNNAHVNTLIQGFLSWVGKPWLGLLAGSIAQAGLYQTLPLDKLLELSEWFHPLPEIHPKAIETLKGSLGATEYECYADEQFNLDVLLRTDHKWLPNLNETMHTVVDYISSRFPNYSHQSFINYTEKYKKKLFKNCPFKNTSEGVELFRNCKITPVICEKMNAQLSVEIEHIRMNYNNTLSSLQKNLKNCQSSLQSLASENNATPVVCEECVCVQPPPVDCNPFCDAKPCPDRCRSTVQQCKELLNITDPPLQPQKYKHDTFEDYMKDYVNNIPHMMYNSVQSMMAYLVATGVGLTTFFTLQFMETQRQRLISENMPYDPTTGRVYGMHRRLAGEFADVLVDFMGGAGSFFGGCMSAAVNGVSSVVSTGLSMVGLLGGTPENAIVGGDLAEAYGRALTLGRNQYSYAFIALRFTFYAGILTWRMAIQATQIAYTFSSQVLMPLSRMMTGRLF